MVVRVDPAEWQDRLRRLDALRDLVAWHIDAEQERQKKYYDKGRRGVAFQVGDLVLRKLHTGPIRYWKCDRLRFTFWKRNQKNRRRWHMYLN